MSYLGAIDIPYMINIFPVNFDNKDEILEYLDKYNAGRPDEEMILYTDLAESITTMSGSIMNAITYVLIAFSSISLVVSVIMIGIITYISVLERTKEIGILRSLGARARDISRVFNAETFIIGVCSGLIGVGIARLLVFPTNKIIENLTDLANVAKMNPLHALMLIVISVALTVIGGAIPAIAASKRDPVIALRTE
jgi:putative ABC transport system permease protein